MATRLHQQQDVAVNLSTLEGKNRKSYTLAFKRQVINFYHAHAGNISLAAKMFSVDRKMVRSWVEQEDFLRRQSDPDALQQPAAQSMATTSSASPSVKAPSGSSSSVSTQRKRLDRNFASGSSARYPELEKALTDWWMLQLSRGQNIKAKALKSQALRFFHELYPHSSDQDFKASTGWLQRFVTRMESNGGLVNGLETTPGVIEQAIKRRFSLENTATHEKPVNPYIAMEAHGLLQRSMNQHPALQSLPVSKKSRSDRAAPYLVPIKPKPAPPTMQYEMPVVVPKALPLQQRRGISPDAQQSEAPVVKYVSMSQQERTDLDRQKKETGRFFSDCQALLTFFQQIEV